MCNWMKTSLKKKKGISVIGEKPDICCCWTVLGSFFFLANDAIKFQEG